MRILIHAVAMRKQGGGSRHLHGFIEALGQLDKENDYLLCLDKRFPFKSSFDNIHTYPVEIHSQGQRFWWDQVVMPRFIKEQKIDLILAIFNFGCFRPPVPQIVFQRNSLFFCDDYLNTLRRFSLFNLNVRVRRLIARLTMRSSVSVVVPSESMRQMIHNYCSEISPEKTIVIPHAFELDYFNSNTPLSPQLKAKLDSAPPEAAKILYTSHLEPYKDMTTAIDLARQLLLSGKSFRLYLTLDERDDPTSFAALQERIAQLGLSEVIINLGRVPEQQIYQIYRQATIFFFSSLCESFGFPMKEALGSGLPIVAAETCINKEICGDAALYFPPRRADIAAAQLNQLLESPAQREELAAYARQRYEDTRLDWNTYTEKILALVADKVGSKYAS